MIATRSCFHPIVHSVLGGVFLGIVISSVGCGAGDKSGPPSKDGPPIAEKTAPPDRPPEKSNDRPKAVAPAEPKKLTPRTVIDTGLGKVCYVAVTPDGKLAAVSSDKAEKLQVWDLQKKEKLAEQQGGNKVLAIAPDGKTVFCRDSSHSLRAVDPKTGKSEETSLSSSNARLSPQCDVLVVTAEGYDAKMTLVPKIEVRDPRKKDGPSREWQFQKERVFSDNVSLAVLWEGDKKVVSGHLDGSVNIWDFTTGKLIKTLTGGHVRGGGEGAVQAAISADGKRLATCGYIKAGEFGKKTKIWDVATGQVVKTLDQLTHDMFLLGDGKVLLYQYYRDVFIENLDTGAKNKLPADVSDCYHVGGCGSALALTPDGKTLVTGSGDGSLKVWDVLAP